MNGRTRLGAFLLISSLIGCSSNGATTSDPNAIVIGALADSTGASATTLYATAINLAASQMNQAMAAAKSSIRFNVRVVDSQSDPVHSQAAVAELINSEGIKGVVTDISGDTVSVNMLNYDANAGVAYSIPVTCYLCSSAFINNPDSTDADMVRQNAMRDGDGWLFRTFFNAKYEAAVQTRIALNRGDRGDVNGDGVFKVGVYASDDAYGQSSAAAVKYAVGELRPESAVEVLFQPPKVDANSYDWASDLRTLLDDRNDETGKVDGEPDAIFITLLSLGATAAAKAYHEAAYTTPLQATTAFRRNYILRSLTSAAEGIEGNSPRLVSDDESGSAFKNAFEIASSGEPTEMGCSGAYDSTIVLMLAAVKAALNSGGNPSDVLASDVRNELSKISSDGSPEIHATVEDFTRAYWLLQAGGTIRYLGASGATNYDSAGDANPALVHWKVQQQRFIESEQYDCGNPLCTPPE